MSLPQEKTKTCRCNHERWDHYKGKCFGWLYDGEICKCKFYREEKK